MKYAPLFLAPLLALAAGCSSAQLSVPPPVDAGPPCPSRAPVLTCDAGAAPSANACSGGLTLYPTVGQGTDAASPVPAGSYEVGCTIKFWVQDVASADCIPTQACTCDAFDAGSPASGDGGAPEEGGAVATGPGAWTCSLSQ
jgi:hypothetical protein